MIKGGFRDGRVEDSPSETDAKNRVDRVFVPGPPRPTDAAAEAALAVLEKRRTPSTSPPVGGAAPAVEAREGDLELSLRRQLSRLQRQVADGQRELADKDEELAIEVEKRLAEHEQSATLADELRLYKAKAGEIPVLEARAQSLEQRLQQSAATHDALVLKHERDLELLGAANARIADLTSVFEETRDLWISERAVLEERMAAETAQIEIQRQAALETMTASVAAASARQRETHEAEIIELKAAHERSLSMLRGELEPKALESRNLAEERERLTSEIAALKNEAVRTAADREQSHAQDLVRQSESHALELGAHSRTAAAQLAKLTADHDVEVLALQQLVRSAQARDQSHEETVNGMREAQLKLQRELTETKEWAVEVEAELVAVEKRRALAQSAAEKLFTELRALKEQLETFTREARRSALERMRFVAYLEEGLAIVGGPPVSASNAGSDESEQLLRELEGVVELVAPALEATRDSEQPATPSDPRP